MGCDLLARFGQLHEPYCFGFYEQHVRHGGFVPTAVHIRFIQAAIAAARREREEQCTLKEMERNMLLLQAAVKCGLGC